MENIEAVNKKSSSLLNTKTNQLVFQVPIGAFEFEKDLMKEHFNENYMETEKYPKATFNGNLLEGVDFGKDGTYSAKATGKLIVFPNLLVYIMSYHFGYHTKCHVSKKLIHLHSQGYFGWFWF